MNLDSWSEIAGSMLRPEAYPHPIEGKVELLETHISQVFLAGAFAYKVKKPVRNHFLDYSTLELREHYCREELRLNQRFSSDLYLSVVPISNDQGLARVDGKGTPVEFAVQMRRFDAEALADRQLTTGKIDLHEIRELAFRIAQFHRQASVAPISDPFGQPRLVYQEALDNCHDIRDTSMQGIDAATILETVASLEHWTIQHFNTHQADFFARKTDGHIRECHGDLHLGNIVRWHGDLIPFDGIEFSNEFRWIDTLNDAAFPAMDLAAHGRWNYCHSFINAYLESTGDYSAIGLLGWYLVYRAMVRAKVSALRASQLRASQLDALDHGHQSAVAQLVAQLELASKFAFPTSTPARLWITFGLSGSGKTTGSERFIQEHGAIRIRSDVERKRIAGILPLERRVNAASVDRELYAPEQTQETYHHLAVLAERILRGGRSVVVDATCLMRWQRNLFRDLAGRLNVPFEILSFDTLPEILRQRITKRQSENRDASDANLEVLERQLQQQQPLAPDEQPCVQKMSQANFASDKQA